MHDSDRAPALEEDGSTAASLEQLLVQLAPCLSRIRSRFGISVDAGMDIEQETVLRFLRSHGEKSSPKAWVLRTYSNECLRYLRRRKLSRERKVDLAVIEAARSSSRTASGEVLAREVDAAVRELGPRQQLAISCRYVEGLPMDQIATRLSLRPSSVKNALSRALAALRRKLSIKTRSGDR